MQKSGITVAGLAMTSPLRDFLLPRLLAGGVDVVIMPAGGDSVDHRGGSGKLFEGSMRVLDMILTEIEKTNGKVSLLLPTLGKFYKTT